MKVRCRGYEGELIDLSATIESKNFKGEYKVVAYELRIALDNANLTLENVKDDEIEFITTVEETNNNIQHYLGDMKLKPISNTEDLYAIIGEIISYQLVDEETGMKYIEEVANRHSKIVL